ncbi:hypothetical protein [Streptomyces sp. NPDC090025]|uniref:hypothetical protein n=1 Tax=Streptomyces sp. NPDC090025 TaxID=3365922 RepID=UPI003834FFEF
MSREALVTEVTEESVSMRWPWTEIDPQSMMRWNGVRVIPRTPNAPDWNEEPFCVTSPDTLLAPGRMCEVGIPGTAAYVVDVDEFPEPLDVGWTPRPHVYVSLVAQGVAISPWAEEIGFTLDPAGAEPIESELVHRPYAFLEDGDEVADAEGRVWAFSVPWNWEPFDKGPGEAPRWPLRLVCRAGSEAPQDAEAVVRATASGAHGDEVARWLRAAGLDEAPDLPPAAFDED